MTMKSTNIRQFRASRLDASWCLPRSNAAPASSSALGFLGTPAIVRPGLMWTDYPTALDYAPAPDFVGQGSAQMHGGVTDPEPVATIHLPNGSTHDVMPPERERIGFRRG